MNASATPPTTATENPIPCPQIEPTEIEVQCAYHPEMWTEREVATAVRELGGTIAQTGAPNVVNVTVPNTRLGRELVECCLMDFALPRTRVTLKGVPKHGRDLFYLTQEECQTAKVETLIERWRDGYVKWWRNTGEALERKRRAAQADVDARMKHAAPTELMTSFRAALESYMRVTGLDLATAGQHARNALDLLTGAGAKE